jgi:hypothetical protein
VAITKVSPLAPLVAAATPRFEIEVLWLDHAVHCVVHRRDNLRAVTTRAVLQGQFISTSGYNPIITAAAKRTRASMGVGASAPVGALGKTSTAADVITMA